MSRFQNRFFWKVFGRNSDKGCLRKHKGPLQAYTHCKHTHLLSVRPTNASLHRLSKLPRLSVSEPFKTAWALMLMPAAVTMETEDWRESVAAVTWRTMESFDSDFQNWAPALTPCDLDYPHRDYLLWQWIRQKGKQTHSCAQYCYHRYSHCLIYTANRVEDKNYLRLIFFSIPADCLLSWSTSVLFLPLARHQQQWIITKILINHSAIAVFIQCWAQRATED